MSQVGRRAQSGGRWRAGAAGRGSRGQGPGSPGCPTLSFALRTLSSKLHGSATQGGDGQEELAPRAVGHPRTQVEGRWPVRAS